MDQEKYKLEWDTYSDHLREMLHAMMKSNELTDVTLVCDDKRQFKAHKIVLSACSSVFKSIFNDLPQHNSVIYLRGIKHQEMEAILEFMYVGVATLNQERMSEFMNDAKNLEIKEISQKMQFDEYENLPDLSNNETDLVNQQKQPMAKLNKEKISNNKQTAHNSTLQNNSGSTLACAECDSQFTNKGHLKRHILSKHEGVRFNCNKCDFQSTQQAALKSHFESKHEGVRYPCDHCNYQATQKDYLKLHIQSKHEGVKYNCNQCNYQLNSRQSLHAHKKRFCPSLKVIEN